MPDLSVSADSLVEVFSKAKSSKSVIEASPRQVHITGFKPGVVSKATIKLINRGSKPIRTQIVNPTSPFFKLTYTRKSKLVPGSAEILTLEFQCSEPRYYYDCIRVQVQVFCLHREPMCADVCRTRPTSSFHCMRTLCLPSSAFLQCSTSASVLSVYAC